MLFAISLIALLSLGVPALFSYLVWRLFGLNKSEHLFGAPWLYLFPAHSLPLPFGATPDRSCATTAYRKGQWTVFPMGSVDAPDSGLYTYGARSGLRWLNYRSSHAGAA